MNKSQHVLIMVSMNQEETLSQGNISHTRTQHIFFCNTIILKNPSTISNGTKRNSSIIDPGC